MSAVLLVGSFQGRARICFLHVSGTLFPLLCPKVTPQHICLLQSIILAVWSSSTLQYMTQMTQTTVLHHHTHQIGLAFQSFDGLFSKHHQEAGSD